MQPLTEMPETYLVLPFLTEDEIGNSIQQLSLNNCYVDYCLDTNLLCESISAIYDVDFIFDQPLSKPGVQTILGKLICYPLSIYLTKDLDQDLNRWRFTLCHEIGHLVLHLRILEPYYSFIDEATDLFNIGAQYSNKVVNRMELQANLFSSYLLMPDHLLLKFVSRYFAEHNNNKGFLYVDNQPVNQIALNEMLEEMGKKFGVSKMAAKFRLKKLELIRGKIKEDSFQSALKSLGYDTWNMNR